MDRRGDRNDVIVDLLVFLAIFGFLIGYFEPQYILSNTITTGGDTASHYYTARYLKETLLPRGDIIGWTYGNYAGFPFFQFYFPLPFLIMAALCLVVPLTVAFKLITVLGIFLLPLTAYFCLKLLAYRFPVPILGALFTLPFLFIESNSMWGGNILSTLAGEFTYSLGLALSVLFIGSLYHGILARRQVITNAALIALIGLSHGYTLLFCGVVSLFFLITRADIFWERLKYLFKVHVLGFLFMGVWLVPLLFNLPYTTRYNHVWQINTIREVFPVIILPLVIVAVGGSVAGVIQARWQSRRQLWARPVWHGVWDALDKRSVYLWFCITVGLFFYLFAARIHVVDIRFLPFIQVILMIIAAIEVGRAVQALKAQGLIAGIVAIGMILWVNYHSVTVKSWVAWNYSGFEAKPLWPFFSALNREIAGSFQDPRVVYEHSDEHNSIGSIRAFESLPLFSGRATLEGLYMQSSVTSPFVFYIQSEISKQASCPLPDYGCSGLNLKAGIRHLEMFNVSDFIVRSDEVKIQIKAHPEFVLKKNYGPYALYRLLTNEGRYVTPLKYEPVLYRVTDWKGVAYRWFKNMDMNDVHLVFTKQIDKEDKKRFTQIIDGGAWERLSKQPAGPACHVEEKLKTEEIEIRTNCLHRPLLVKVSYHPNWQVEGADKIYLASPSFMLIFPEQEKVRLYYAKTTVEYIGIFLTLAGFFAIIFTWRWFEGSRVRRLVDSHLARVSEAIAVRLASLFDMIKRNRHARRTAKVACLMLIVILLALMATGEDPPAVLYQKGIAYMNKEQYAKAKALFETIIERYPDTTAAGDASYNNAIIHMKEGDDQGAIEQFKRLIALNPQSHFVPEAYYHIALLHGRLNRWNQAQEAYQLVVDRYGNSRWAEYAKIRLQEMTLNTGLRSKKYYEGI